MIKKCSIVGALLVSMLPAYGMYLMRPYEQMLRPEWRQDFCWQMSILAEHGFGTQNFNEDGRHVNPLLIWNQDQDALKMLEGFDASSRIGQRRIVIAANDDGVRGHFDVSGDLKYKGQVSCSARIGLPYDLSVAVYLPFYALKLTDVVWTNKTRDITADDARVREYLTNNFFANVEDLGGLSLQGWSRSGLGDVTIMAEWLKDFAQKKDILNNVRLTARAAFGLPTGKKSDEDRIFALSFGNDGAFSFLLGGGLTLTLASYLRVGVDVELTHLFSTTRNRRIKTQIDQTELLLLQKVDVLRDYGLTQRFNLYVEMFRFLGGFSCKVGYQFLRHGDDMFTVCNNRYSSFIANTANSLQEWTLHNLFFVASYDGSHDECNRVHPYVSVYARVPFNGQFMSGQKACGIMISLDF